MVNDSYIMCNEIKDHERSKCLLSVAVNDSTIVDPYITIVYDERIGQDLESLFTVPSSTYVSIIDRTIVEIPSRNIESRREEVTEVIPCFCLLLK